MFSIIPNDAHIHCRLIYYEILTLFTMWFLWICFSFAWSFYDSVVNPTNWSNFTSWCWILQAIFLAVFLLDRPEFPFFHNIYFLNCFFLPFLFACEYSVIMLVVYMTIDGAELFENQIDIHGIIVVGMANFTLHVLNLMILLLYMLLYQKTILEKISCYKEIFNSLYTNLLYLQLNIFIYTYISVFSPGAHYGVKNISEIGVDVIFLISANLGLTSFFWWSKVF